MRTKHYAALFAFIAAFAMAAVVANFFKLENGSLVLWDETKTAQKINELLTADIANGQERAFSEDSLGATLNYADEMEALDDSNLPADFRRAWREHKRAWRIQANLISNAGRYRTDESLQRAWMRNNKEITRTWYRVLNTAKEHKAEIPAGAYN